VQWVPDRTMGCEHCGPWVREQKARAYLAKIGSTPLFRRQVAADAWPTAAKGLRRAGADYLQVPASGEIRVVLSDKGPGQPVADNEEEILGLLAAYPAGCGRNISASKAWQPAKAQVKAKDDDQRVYTFRFIVQAGLEHAREVAHELGLFMGEVEGSGGAAFLLRQPADPVTWGRFRRWAQVESIEELERRRAEAKARRQVEAA
jgi:hypothetical protein